MGFGAHVIAIVIFTLSIILFLLSYASEDVGFDQNYKAIWGNHHILLLNQGRDVQLTLDQSSGAGFGSKDFYSSGSFQLRIKLSNKDTTGLVTAFYLNSSGSIHDEIDFEFLGNRRGKPVTLQTNVFTNGIGGREQKNHLWFDPADDFHAYTILWNYRQIAFFVDDIPIRVFKNNVHRGVGYVLGTMQVIVSFWDGSNWATDGGRSKTDYSQAPFQAHFQNFHIDGCPSVNKDCNARKYWWNDREYWHLSRKQQRILEDNKKYVTYDYCADRNRYPTPLSECIE